MRMVLQNGILPEGQPFFIPESQSTGAFASLVLPLGQWDALGRPECIDVTVTNADADLVATGEFPVVVLQGPDNDMVEDVVEILDAPPAPVARARRYSHGGRVELPAAAG